MNNLFQLLSFKRPSSSPWALRNLATWWTKVSRKYNANTITTVRGSTLPFSFASQQFNITTTPNETLYCYILIPLIPTAEPAIGQQLPIKKPARATKASKASKIAIDDARKNQHQNHQRKRATSQRCGDQGRTRSPSCTNEELVSLQGARIVMARRKHE
jgi:hypothetical protein